MSQDIDLAKFLKVFCFLFLFSLLLLTFFFFEGQIGSKEKLDFPSLVFGVVTEIPRIDSSPGSRLSSQNLPSLFAKMCAECVCHSRALAYTMLCFLQLTWTGSMMTSSVTVALPGITRSTWERSWRWPMWSSFHAASSCNAVGETVAVELSAGSPVRAIQGKLWRSITRYAVFRFLCCSAAFSPFQLQKSCNL